MAVDPSTLMTSIDSKITSITSTANGYADQLASLATAYFDNWQDITRPSELSLTSIPDLEIPSLPDFDSIQMPGFDDIYSLDKMLPSDYNSLYRYSSSFLDFLKGVCQDHIENGGLGIGADVQQAIFDKQSERDEQVLNDSLLKVELLEARKGFPIPTDMLKAARNELILARDWIRYDRSREITALIAERTQSNIQNAMKCGIDIESMIAQNLVNYAQAYVAIINALMTKYKSQIDVYMAKFDAEIKTITAQNSVRELNARTDLEEKKNLITI